MLIADGGGRHMKSHLGQHIGDTDMDIDIWRYGDIDIWRYGEI